MRKEKNIKIKPSLGKILITASALLLVLSSFLFTLFGFVDLRTDEQKAEEYREELREWGELSAIKRFKNSSHNIGWSSFSDKNIGKLTFLRIRWSGSIVRILIVESKSSAVKSGLYAYTNSGNGTVYILNSSSYKQMREFGLLQHEKTFVGNEINILVEEVNKL